MASDTESIANSTGTSPSTPTLASTERTPSFLSAIDTSNDAEDTVYRGGRAYLRGNALPAKKKGKRRNWLWTKGEELYCKERKSFYWQCGPCAEVKNCKIFAANSTQWIIQHLNQEHNLTENGPIRPTFKLQVAPTEDIKSDSSVLGFLPIIDFERLKQRLIEWIVVMHITFSQVENEWFRRFLEVLSPSLANWIPQSGNTVKNWILTEFKRRQKEIRNQLQISKSRIHLSFDLWTSPNHMTFVGVVGHYMSSQYKVETVLLGLRRLRGPHSGENIAEAVIDVIRKYEITDRIGYFVLDNASSNDTCVAEILKSLDINDLSERCRLRCLGYIINFNAKVFLFGADPDAFKREIKTAH